MTPGNRVASKTVFKPGRTYKVKVSGTVAAKSQTESFVFSAFHCLEGCPASADHAYYSHLRIYNKADGTPLTPNNLKQDGKSEDANYNSAGKYTLTFDKFADDTMLEWSAEPHGKNPDASGRYYSGAGFRVEIGQDPRLVTFKFKQEGLPTEPPKEMISSQFGVKGSILLPDVDFDDRSVDGDPRGSAAYVAINDGKDHLVAFRVVDGRYMERSGGRELILKVKVRKSNAPGCAQDSVGALRLFEARQKDDDRALLRSRPCKYNLEWTRKSTDEFHMSVGKPQ